MISNFFLSKKCGHLFRRYLINIVVTPSYKYQDELWNCLTLNYKLLATRSISLACAPGTTPQATCFSRQQAIKNSSKGPRIPAPQSPQGRMLYPQLSLRDGRTNKSEVERPWAAVNGPLTNSNEPLLCQITANVSSNLMA